MTPRQRLIYNAVKDGAETARDVEGYTGLTPKIAATYLSRLAQSGLLTTCGRRVYPGSSNNDTCYKVKRSTP